MHFSGTSASERRYLPPAVAVSTVAFALRPPPGAFEIDVVPAPGDADPSRPTLWIPLVRRTRAPFRGRWALPGGPTRWDETLADTAMRSMRAAARCTPGYLEQLYAFGGVERSAQAQRLVTIAYWAMIGEAELDGRPVSASGPLASSESTGSSVSFDAEAAAVPAPAAASERRWDDPELEPGLTDAPDALGAATPGARDDAGSPGDPDPNVAWCSADRLPELAFDHSDIVDYALVRLRSKTEYAAVAHRFLGPTFTIAQLRGVHEAVLGRAVDAANFRRQTLAQGLVVDTGEREIGSPHRPARLFRFASETAPVLPTDRPEPRSHS